MTQPIIWTPGMDIPPPPGFESAQGESVWSPAMSTIPPPPGWDSGQAVKPAPPAPQRPLSEEELKKRPEVQNYVKRNEDAYQWAAESVNALNRREFPVTPWHDLSDVSRQRIERDWAELRGGKPTEAQYSEFSKSYTNRTRASLEQRLGHRVTNDDYRQYLRDAQNYMQAMNALDIARTSGKFGMAEWAATVPEDRRDEVLKAVAAVAAREKPGEKLGAFGRFGAAAAEGVGNLVGILSATRHGPKTRGFATAVAEAIEKADPIMGSPYNPLNIPKHVIQMAPDLMTGRAFPVVAGVKGMQSTQESLVNQGVSEGTATAAAVPVGIFTGLVFSKIPKQLFGGADDRVVSLLGAHLEKKFGSRFAAGLGNYATTMGKVGAETGIVNITDAEVQEVTKYASGVTKNPEFTGALVEALKSTAAGLVPVGAIAAPQLRVRRAAGWKPKYLKGPSQSVAKEFVKADLPEAGNVSRAEWRAAGLPKQQGKTQAERNAYRDSLRVAEEEPAPIPVEQTAEGASEGQAKSQLQPQGEPNAKQIEEAAPPDAGGSPRVETEVPQRPEPVSSERVREGGQESGEIPAEEAQAEIGTPPSTPPPSSTAAPLGGTVPSAPWPAGIKHADVDVLRQQIGAAARQPDAPYTDQQAINDAITRTSADVDLSIARMAAGKAVDKHDNANLLRRRVELGNALDAAVARGDTVAQQAIVNDLSHWAEADTVGGRTQGRGLQSRKMMANADNSLAGLTIRAAKAKNGDPVTTEEFRSLKEVAAKWEAKSKDLAAQVSREAEARLAAEEKLLEAEKQAKVLAADAEKQAKVKERRRRAAAKAEEVRSARRRELYDAAEQAGIGAKALEERARELVEPDVEKARQHNAALADIERKTGLKPGVIKGYERRGEDIATHTKHLDEMAPQLHREYPEFFKSTPPSEEGGASADRGNSVQELIDGLREGRKAIPDWRDYLEQAAETLKLDVASFNPAEFEAEGVTPGGKRPLRKPTAQRAAASEKTSAALTRLKVAWEALGRVGAVYDPKVEAQKQAEVVAAAVEVGRAYLSEGVVRLSEFLANARQAIGGDWDKIRPHLIGAWNQLRASGDAPSPMLDPADRAEIGRYAKKIHREFYEAGVPDRESRVDAVWDELKGIDPAITRVETVDAMSGYGDFRELSKDQISLGVRRDRGELQQLRKRQDLNNALTAIQDWRAQGVSDAEIAKRLVDQKLLPKKTGVERRKIDDVERQLQKEVNDLRKKMPVQPIPAEQQLATAFSIYERTLLNRRADLREALRTGEAIPEGTKPTFSAQQQAHLDAIRKENAELTEAYRKLHPTKTQRARMERAADLASQAEWEAEGGATDVKTRQELVLDAARVLDGIAKRMQAEVDQLRAEGWKKKPEAQKLTAPMLTAKRAKIEAIKAQRDELLALDPAKQADIAVRSDAAYTRALQTRLAKNLVRNAEMDRTGELPAKKPVRKLSKEQLELKRQLRDAADDAHQLIEQIKWNNLSRLQKSLRIPGKTFQGIKSLWASLDFSFIGRQGLTLAVSHPISAIKAQKRSIGAFWSDAKAFEIQEDIRNKPNALNGVYERMGLDLPELDGPAARREELYAVQWPERIPIVGRGVKASERAFVAQGNQQRTDVADAMLASLLRKGPAEATDIELEIIGHYVNAASWRGDLGRFEQAAVALSNFFWTPRGYVGQFEYLLGSALWAKHAGKGTARVRKVVAMEYARGLAGRALFYGTAAAFLGATLGLPSDDPNEGWSISLNPYSADFGKVRIGRRRIDVMGGLAQPTRFITRLSTNTVNGIRQLFGDQVSKESKKEMAATGSIVARFLGSKIAPVGSLAHEVGSGETYEGATLTPGQLTYEAVVPLSLRDIHESMTEFGVPAGTALGTLAIFGFGGMTYKPKKSGKPIKVGSPPR